MSFSELLDSPNTTLQSQGKPLRRRTGNSLSESEQQTKLLDDFDNSNAYETHSSSATASLVVKAASEVTEPSGNSNFNTERNSDKFDDDANRFVNNNSSSSHRSIGGNKAVHSTTAYLHGGSSEAIASNVGLKSMSADEAVFSSARSLMAGISISIAQLQQHCAMIQEKTIEAINAPSKSMLDALMNERQTAVSIFNYIRGLFFELSKLHEIVDEEQRKRLEEESKDLYRDFGDIVREYELVCFSVEEIAPVAGYKRRSRSNSSSSKHHDLARISSVDAKQRKDEILHEIRNLEEQRLMMEDPNSEENLRRQEQLECELLELNSMFHKFSELVQKSAQVVHRLETQVEETRASVEDGTQNLSTAAKLQSALYPVLFGIVGGLVGGPIGLIAGMKGGGLVSAAAIGASFGAASGIGVKSLKKKLVDREKKKIEHKEFMNDMEDTLRDEPSKINRETRVSGKLPFFGTSESEKQD